MNKKSLSIIIIIFLFLPLKQNLSMEKENPVDSNPNTKIALYKCSLCDNSNKQISRVRRHILHIHCKQPEVRIYGMTSEGSIVQALEVKDLGKEYSCTQCNEKFRDPTALYSHMKIHPILNISSENSVEKTEQAYGLQVQPEIYEQRKKILSSLEIVQRRKDYFIKYKESLKYQLEKNNQTLQQKTESIPSSNVTPLIKQIEQPDYIENSEPSLDPDLLLSPHIDQSDFEIEEFRKLFGLDNS